MKSILMTALLMILSNSSFANYCLVTSDNDGTATSETLRHKIQNTLISSYANCSLPTADVSDRAYFDQIVLFVTDEFNMVDEDDKTIDVEEITLNSEISVDVAKTTVIGNWSEDAANDITVDIDPSMPDNQNFSTEYKDAYADYVGYGYVLLEASSLGKDVSPFKCDDSSAAIYLRNVVIHTDSVSEEEMYALSPCIRNAGAVEVCEGVLIDKTDPEEANSSSAPTTATVSQGSTSTASRTFTASRISSATFQVADIKVTDFTVGGYRGIGSDDESATTVERYDINDRYACEITHTTDICNGVDDDNDGQIDEDATFSTYYQDTDNDGYGNPEASIWACEAGEGYVANDDDCDDANGAINPNAEEICDEGIDNDCDEWTVEDCTVVDTDEDDDGYDGTDHGGDDCDDTNSDIHPGAEEICDEGIDNDCDASTVEECPVTDTDGDDDGYDGVDHGGDDCDDANADVNPGKTEVCDNSIDDDCDGTVDCGTSSEVCDGLDNNGDGTIDEGFTDTDGDGTADCTDVETCDFIDNNGDGQIDEGFDGDGDGITSCTEVGAENCLDGIDNDNDGAMDCDDSLCSTTFVCNNVGPEEECADGVDNDDDGATDCQDGDCVTEVECTVDNDQDGFAPGQGDCDDTNPDVNPDVIEDDVTMCEDDVDNNCDGIDPVCQGTIIPGGGGSLISGGCGCDLKSASAPSHQDFVQMIMAMIPIGTVLGLRKRAKAKAV